MTMTLITTNTESGDATSSFTSSIDSTYKLYIFKWINCNPATDNQAFKVNFSTDGGSNYNMSKTVTSLLIYHGENDGGGLMENNSNLGNNTGGMALATGTGNGADEHTSGTLWLFNPSNTTYVKHIYSVGVNYYSSDQMYHRFSSGYINSTSDVDAVQFKFDSGNFDGTIKMYGVG